MSKFYLNAETIGNNICTRYIKNGHEHFDRVPYEPTLYQHGHSATGYKDIYGKDVTPKKFNLISDARNWAKKMKDMNLEVQGNQNYEIQYLHETYPTEVKYNKSQVRIAMIDIEVFSDDGFPTPEICRWEIDAISHYDSVDDTFYVFSTRVWEAAKSELEPSVLQRTKYRYFSTEREMMRSYLEFWSSNYPVIVSGWNSEGFDIPYIINRIKFLFGEAAVNRLSPYGKVSGREVKNQFGQTNIVYKIAGVASLDYMLLYKKFRLVTRASYKLDYIAQEELGDAKLEFEGKLWELALNDPQKYVCYNLRDSELLLRLDESIKLFDLVLSLTYYAKINFGQVMSPVATWDSIIYGSLKDKNVIVPENRHHDKEPFEGAFVKDPFVGMHNWVVSLDLESLYPGVIRQCNISPETIVDSFTPKDISTFVSKEAIIDHKGHSATPNGMLYTKEKKGVIPEEITKVFAQRKAAKGNEFKSNFLASKCKKILANRKN